MRSQVAPSDRKIPGCTIKSPESIDWFNDRTHSGENAGLPVEFQGWEFGESLKIENTEIGEVFYKFYRNDYREPKFGDKELEAFFLPGSHAELSLENGPEGHEHKRTEYVFFPNRGSSEPKVSQYRITYGIWAKEHRCKVVITFACRRCDKSKKLETLLRKILKKMDLRTVD